MPALPPRSDPDQAPGSPGTPPTWTSSAKDMVGCALGPARLWFTVGFGILNEVYYPRVDIPQIRDLGFIVAGPGGFWSEVKRNANYRLRLVAPGVPAVEIRHEHPRYALQLRLTPDPLREVLLIECTLDGDDALRLYTLLAPHLGPRATAMLPRPNGTAAGACCGPSKARSGSRSPRPTRIKAMASTASAPAMSAPATAGRILPVTVR